jgi:hypothetical protein
VREFMLVGVRGELYYPSHRDPVAAAVVGMALDHPDIRWVRAGQLVVSLRKFSLVNLDNVADHRS